MVRREGASPKEIQSQGLKCYGETLMVPRLLEKSKWKEIPNRFDKHLGTGMSRASGRSFRLFKLHSEGSVEYVKMGFYMKLGYSGISTK